VAEVGAGVIGEQHGDEVKLVAWSLGRGMAGGAGSTVWCSHGGGGRCRLYFGEFLWGQLGGRQLDVRALLREVRAEPRGGCSGGGRGGPRHGARAAAERRREAEEQSGMGAGSEW
jgi:hypothetical protein